MIGPLGEQHEDVEHGDDYYGRVRKYPAGALTSLLWGRNGSVVGKIR